MKVGCGLCQTDHLRKIVKKIEKSCAGVIKILPDTFITFPPPQKKQIVVMLDFSKTEYNRKGSHKITYVFALFATLLSCEPVPYHFAHIHFGRKIG